MIGGGRGVFALNFNTAAAPKESKEGPQGSGTVQTVSSWDCPVLGTQEHGTSPGEGTACIPWGTLQELEDQHVLALSRRALPSGIWVLNPGWHLLMINTGFNVTLKGRWKRV